MIRKNLLLIVSILSLSFCGSVSFAMNKSQQIIANEYVEDEWDGSTASSFESGSGTLDNPYIIAHASQLSYLRTSLSSNSYYENKYISLTTNINLKQIQWNGIGSGTLAGSFKGTFLGNNKIIRGLSVNAAASYRGFFNSISGEARDLQVEGTITGGGSSYKGYGLFAGVSYGILNNCSSKGDVDVIGTYVGGLVGVNAGKDMTNCSYLSGTTKGTNMVGGITGYNMQYSSKIGKLINCKNYGTITAKDYLTENYSGIGGIVGVCGSNTSITNCINYGEVIGEGKAIGGTGGIVGNNFNSSIIDCENQGLIQGKEYVGGIVGLSRNASLVKGSINKGKIVGSISVAGIVGYSRMFIEDCDNQGEIEADISNNSYWIGGITGMLGSNLHLKKCSNSGYVHGLGSLDGGVGGIVGSNYNSLVEDCNNSGLVQGMYRVAGIVGYAQSTNGIVYNCINSGDFKSIAKYGTVSLGGIVGYNQASIVYCVNNGHYIVNENVEMYGYIVGYDTVGDSGVYNNINNV